MPRCFQTRLYYLFALICCVSLPILCLAEEPANKTVSDTNSSVTLPEQGTVAMPEDYLFNVESISDKPEDNWKKWEFHGFFASTSPLHGRDEESQQSSVKFVEENELTLWMGKRITRNLSFTSEVEIVEGFQKYGLETCAFDYEIVDEWLIFRAGKFKYPLGIERFVEDGPLDKLVDRPAPSIRIIPGTYSDIGGMLHGTIPMPFDTKVKYELALTNGLEGPNNQDVQQLWDNNSNKTIGGRLGYEFMQGLEIGGSYSRGKYDEDNQHDIDFLVADIQFKRGNLEARGEYITSHVEQETLDGGDYHRNGYYLQTSYKYPVDINYFRYVEGVLRFDSIDPNRDVTGVKESDRVAFGINYSPMERVEFKFEQVLEKEPGELVHGKSFVQAIFRW